MPLAKLARTEALAARFEFLASTSAPVGALSLMGLAGQLYLFKVSFRSKSTPVLWWKLRFFICDYCLKQVDNEMVLCVVKKSSFVIAA
jgi:hypothetical protein